MSVSGLGNNIVVLGVGHSGTTVVTRMLGKLGWNLGEVKGGVAENLKVQQINKGILVGQGVCPCGSDHVRIEKDDLVVPVFLSLGSPCVSDRVRFEKRCLYCDRCGQATPMPGPAALPAELDKPIDIAEPWVVKDPRLVVTWAAWEPVFQASNVLVLHIERDIERMKRTYERHRFSDHRIYGYHIQELRDMARGHYRDWQGPKVSLRYEDLAEAVKLFDQGRV